MARRSTAGFTFLEIMIVVAIIGVAAAVISLNITRNKERHGIKVELRALRSAIERTRTVSMMAGARLGSPRLNLTGSCSGVQVPGAPAVHPAMQIMADGTYNFPDSLTPNGADPDVLDVNCKTQTLGTGENGLANLTYNGQAQLAAPQLLLTFSSGGRMMTDAPGNDFYVRIQHNDPNEPQLAGIRVLSSGIICSSSDPAGATLCDQDP